MPRPSLSDEEPTVGGHTVALEAERVRPSRQGPSGARQSLHSGPLQHDLPRGAGCDEEETYRLWWGLLVGAGVSLSGFWGPVGLALWWWLR